jgi:ethanolaminephosphotransferase
MNDWNLLIAHYLGLDHIGHASGAFNSLIKDKLSEMDEIIEKIFSKMTKNDLLIITGDHGMADKGGHGGSSYVETHVPAVFISNQLKQIEKDEEEYLQIDLTPTLSALLEIPIPWNNLGILIESILEKFYHKEKSYLLKCLIDDNRRQLFNLLSNTKLSISLDNLQLIRDQAMSISNEQDLRMLLLSIILFWFVRKLISSFRIYISSFRVRLSYGFMWKNILFYQFLFQSLFI